MKSEWGEAMKKFLKVTALVLTAIFMFSILAFAIDGINMIPVNAGSQTGAVNSDDRRIAEEISNMTGVTVEEILSVRNTCRSWNDVLCELKSDSYRLGENAARRETYLLQPGIEETDIKKLRNEGFTDDELQQAALLIERVIFQLREISAADNAVYTMPETGSPIDNKEDERGKFRELADLIDIKKCLYLVLKLRNEFGSMESVMDEYLFSIQAGIDMALYIADKEEYLKQRNEKEIEPEFRDIITTRKIEEKLLELLSQKKDIDKTDIASPDMAVFQKNFEIGSSAGSNILPDISLPETRDLRPTNPAESIMKEIDILDPMKTGHGGN